MTGWGVAPRVRHPAGACYAELGVLFIAVLALLVLFILVLGRCFVLMADGALDGHADAGARRLLICACV